MDIGKAFSYVFEDEGWISKILIGGLVILIPFVGWAAAAGYMMKVAQNVAQGNQRPLPAWNEFGEHVTRGLYVLVIFIVYAIPVLIVTIPYIFIVIGQRKRWPRCVEAIGGVLACLFIPLMIILGLLSSLLSYAALARYVTTNNLSDALKFNEVIAAVRGNFMPWVMLPLVGILARLRRGSRWRDRLRYWDAVHRLLRDVCPGPRARSDGGEAEPPTEPLHHPADAADRL